MLILFLFFYFIYFVDVVLSLLFFVLVLAASSASSSCLQALVVLGRERSENETAIEIEMKRKLVEPVEQRLKRRHKAKPTEVAKPKELLRLIKSFFLASAS